MVEEPTIFMTRLVVEDMLKIENKKPSVSSITLHLKPPYSVEVAVKPYRARYTVPSFRSLIALRQYKRACCMLLWFYGCSCARYWPLLKGILKFLTDRAYIWYVNLKPGLLNDWEPLFSDKLFYAKAKFSLAELTRMRQYLEEDLYVFVRRWKCPRLLSFTGWGVSS